MATSGAMSVINNGYDTGFTRFDAALRPLRLRTMAAGDDGFQVKRRGSDIMEHETKGYSGVGKNIAEIMAQRIEYNLGLTLSDLHLPKRIVTSRQ